MPATIPTLSTIVDYSDGIMSFGFNQITFDLDQDVYRWLNAMSAQPSSQFVYNLNTMVSKLKGAAIWDNLDRIWIFATEDRQHAQICLKTLSTITEVASPNWTANQGYSGNGSTSYLNSNYIMSTHGANYVQNNSSFGVYSRTNIAGAYIDIGSYDGGGARRAYFYIRRSDVPFNNKSISALNTAIDNSASAPTVTDSRGLFSLARTISTAYVTYKNGISIGGSSLNSTTLTTNSNFILGLNTSVATLSTPSARQLSMAYFGSGNINQLSFYNIFQEFATNQGFNV